MNDNSIFYSIGKFLINLFINKENEKKGVLKPTELDVTANFDGPVENKENNQNNNGIDWTKATYNITPHFTVGEMIALHDWNRLANENDGLTDEVKANILKLAQKMEQVRTHLGCGINVHCGFRSVKYNQEVLKSIPKDVHSMGLAIDIDCNPNLTIEQIKEKMIPVLDSMDLRLEKGTTTWVHLDMHSVGPSGRYFTA